MSFLCSRCGDTFTQKKNLIYHLQRKSACQILNTEQPEDELDREVLLEELLHKSSSVSCEYCDKQLSNKYYIKKHLTTCKAYNEIIKLREEIESLKGKSKENTKPVASTSQTNNISNNGNNNTFNNTNVTNVNVYKFGSEDVDYLLNHKNFRNAMLHYISSMYGLSDLIVEKHFNKHHPENQTVRKQTKGKFIETFNGNMWKTLFSDDAIEQIISKLGNIFETYIQSLKEDGCEPYETRKMTSFLKRIGIPLGIDFSDEYTIIDDLTDEQKQEVKTKVYTLINEIIYKKTQELKL